MSIFSAFRKPLLQTRLEFLCQNTGITFQVNVHQSHKSFTCRHCSRETFVVDLGEGHGNVSVTYIEAHGNSRKLDPIYPDAKGNRVHNALAQYTETGGTFVVVEQEQL
jgi:hypothetical protein